MQSERPEVIKITFDKVSVYREHSSFRRTDYLPYKSFEKVSENEHFLNSSSPDNSHLGSLSFAARKNLIRTIKRFVFLTATCNAEKRKIGSRTKRSLKFVTLTLASAQIHSDLEIKEKLLNQFLTELRENFGLKNYVWKAEKQKNGNIHFHIIIDIFIHWREIRERWNRIQNKLNYVDRFRNLIESGGFNEYAGGCLANNPSISLAQIQERWQKGQLSNWSQPPGTEIRNVAKIRDVHAYFAKYFAKDDFLSPGFGRIWFASRSLTFDLAVYEMPLPEFWATVNLACSIEPWRYRKYDYCEIFLLPAVDWGLYFPSKFADFLKIEFETWAFKFW
jgi:hypothetical protein